jgi:hypothetical protein
MQFWFVRVVSKYFKFPTPALTIIGTKFRPYCAIVSFFWFS